MIGLNLNKEAPDNSRAASDLEGAALNSDQGVHGIVFSNKHGCAVTCSANYVEVVRSAL
ncbi:hypothetical protein ACPOL_2896 [Acidisarcina polymorpha]|uniref:Uncharacterized protein n=1 Tax=Acidisarcina polymorpha TaxID=2211140 RepID=A0A2Z5FZP9_9BACT|nr:hypothetical protein ACPOL_2896 [Acidisarcina polymorpha]